MATGYPSSTNMFVPSFEASGKLIVGYSRKPEDFSVMNYLQLVTVKKPIGYYLRITPEEAGRVLTTDLSEFAWPDGADAPHGDWGTESHEFFPFETHRRSFAFRLGYEAAENADWEVLSAHAAIRAQQAMTARTLLATTELTTSGNYPTGHTDTATNWGGGFWSAGTSTNPIIKKALNKMANKILLSSLAGIKISDLVLVVSPTVAIAMSESAEIHDFVKGSPLAWSQVRGDMPSTNARFGLPDQVYGFKVVIEDAVRVSSKKGATLVQAYAMDTNKAALVARPGGVAGLYGAPSFSFLTGFFKEEMTVESRDDPDNRRHLGRVVENYVIKVTAPVAGALATAVLS